MFMEESTLDKENRFYVFSMYWIMFLKCTSRKQLEFSQKQIESTLCLLETHLIQRSASFINNDSIFRTVLYLWVNLIDAFGLGFEKISMIQSLIHQIIISFNTTIIEKCLNIRLVRVLLMGSRIPISTEIYRKAIESFWDYVQQSMLIEGWRIDPVQDYHLIQGVSELIILKIYTLDTLFRGFRQLVGSILLIPPLCDLVAKSIITACMGTGYIQTLAWSLLRNEIIFELVGLTDYIAKNCLDYLRSSIELSTRQLSDTSLINFIQIMNILSTTINRKAGNQHLSDILIFLLEFESLLGNGQFSIIARSKFYMYLYILVTNGLCPPILFPRFIHLERLFLTENSSIDLVRISILSRRIVKAWLSEILNTNGTNSYLHPTIDDYLNIELQSDLRLDVFRIIINSLEKILEEK